jgi:hypothetical protein
MGGRRECHAAARSAVDPKRLGGDQFLGERILIDFVCRVISFDHLEGIVM